MIALVRVSTKSAIMVLFLFSVFVEVLILPTTLGEVRETFPEVSHLIVPAFVGAALVMLCGQAMIAITWILTTMSKDERIFSPRALRLVTALTTLPFVIVTLLTIAFISLNVLGFTQPGVMYLILGSLTVTLAVGFILITMRSLLMRSTTLYTEMSEVV